jgi:hypothetical protein
MAAALFGDEIDRTAYVDREGLLYAVQRTIMCQAGGGILDVRTAVYVTISREGNTLAALVVTGAKFDEIGGMAHVHATAEKFSATFEVIDGRHYKADGTLRKDERARREALAAEAASEAVALDESA